MKRLALAFAILTVSSTLTLLASSSGKVAAVAALLSGTFEGSTPGNHLKTDVRPVTLDPGHSYDLFLTVSGQYQDDYVRLQGVIRLEQQGQGALLTYIPHFDPTVTSLSSDAGSFTERELSSACTMSLSPRGDGFFAETPGTTSCSFALRGAVGKWTLEIEPGGLRVRNVQSGETLRFREVGGSEAPR
jgi:hypothetical protein